MKPTEKKQVVEPVRVPQPKQSSGDKAFDNAIDKMLKKPSTYTQSK